LLSVRGKIITFARTVIGPLSFTSTDGLPVDAQVSNFGRKQGSLIVDRSTSVENWPRTSSNELGQGIPELLRNDVIMESNVVKGQIDDKSSATSALAVFTAR
jgi:hypothetical protein